MQIKNFGHAGNCGDTWAALPSLKTYYEKSGIKPVLYLIKDHPAIYYEGAVHPIKNEIGGHVCLNQAMIDKMMPLLKVQPYLEDVRQIDWEDKSSVVQVNLSEVRNTFVNAPYGMLSRWYFYVFPDFACDLSKQYIFVPDAEKDFANNKIIISRTERYQNQNIEYDFLKEYEDDLLFSGTMREYNNFCMNFDLNIPKLDISNFLELAQALKQSKGLISNQTQIVQIAEGLKTPRAVELCHFAPNVIPIGEKAYDFYSMQGLQWYFHEFNGTTATYLEQLKGEQKYPDEQGIEKK